MLITEERREERSEPKAAFYKTNRWDGISPTASRVSTNDARFEWTALLEVPEFVRYVYLSKVKLIC